MPLEFWTTTGWLVILGTFAMAFINIFKRGIVKDAPISTLQYLISWYGMTTFCFGAIYATVWGFTVPELLPGFWRTVFFGALINVGIQYCNARAASMDGVQEKLAARIEWLGL